jgi:hypothetical protein
MGTLKSQTKGEARTPFQLTLNLQNGRRHNFLFFSEMQATNLSVAQAISESKVFFAFFLMLFYIAGYHNV